MEYFTVGRTPANIGHALPTAAAFIQVTYPPKSSTHSASCRCHRCEVKGAFLQRRAEDALHEYKCRCIFIFWLVVVPRLIRCPVPCARVCWGEPRMCYFISLHTWRTGNLKPAPQIRADSMKHGVNKTRLVQINEQLISEVFNRVNSDFSVFSVRIFSVFFSAALSDFSSIFVFFLNFSYFTD